MCPFTYEQEIYIITNIFLQLFQGVSLELFSGKFYKENIFKGRSIKTLCHDRDQDTTIRCTAIQGRPMWWPMPQSKGEKRWTPKIREVKDEILHKTHSPRY